MRIQARDILNKEFSIIQSFLTLIKALIDD